jgi:hypothetical protein
MMSRWFNSCFALMVVAASLPSFAQFTYAPINVPGAVATAARGINNNGEIVGFYKTTSCQDIAQEYDIAIVPTCAVKGFKYVNGTYVKLMVPNSTSTAILGVNDLGDLVGFYRKSDGSSHGFIWYHTNVVKTIDRPNAGNSTVPFGINKAGTVVGQSGFGGWVWVNGTFSTMNPTPKPNAGACCWSVTGIANSGVIAGYVFNADFFHAWYKAGTDEDFFTYPTGGTAQCCDTFATGVNSKNDMVGEERSGWFAKNIEANEGTGDSTEKKPTFITIKYPNTSGGNTVPFGVNNLRGVVGTYIDSSGKEHGFLAKANF